MIWSIWEREVGTTGVYFFIHLNFVFWYHKDVWFSLFKHERPIPRRYNFFCPSSLCILTLSNVYDLGHMNIRCQYYKGTIFCPSGLYILTQRRCMIWLILAWDVNTSLAIFWCPSRLDIGTSLVHYWGSFGLNTNTCLVCAWCSSR